MPLPMGSIDLSEVPENLKDNFSLKFQGAEAKIYFGELCGKPAVLKERFVKKYRHPALDSKLTSERLKAEGKALLKCVSIGVNCPSLYFVDFNSHFLVMERIENSLTVRECIENVYKGADGKHSPMLNNVASKIGETVARIHSHNLIHGDLTTSNMLIKDDQSDDAASGENFDLYLIDFGLSYHSTSVEDKAVDLYALERAFLSTHPDSEEIFQKLLTVYFKNMGKEGPNVSKKLDEVRQRGRKRSMVG